MRKKRKSIVKNNVYKNNRILFMVELCLAILLSVGCSLIGMSNILTSPSYIYPAATDFLGHMTKVIYIANQLSQGHIPSWFPYWYNGSTTTQYYVPLSYYIMVPIYWGTNNIMLTFKIFCASVMTIGSLGVWTFCYKKIGRFCGLIGILTFSLQPLLLQSLYKEGVIAQGPIFAILPWFLLIILSAAKKPSRGKFIGITVLTTLLILSHAMHAFMVCFVTIAVMFIFFLIRKITIRNFIIASLGIVFAGILTAFWSLVGATGIENPGIPYLLADSATYATANLKWFLPNEKSTFFYYSIEVTVLSILGLICYLVAKVKKRNNENVKYYVLACLLLTIITTFFAFGMSIPGFRYIPFASSMVPGRILTYTAVTGAISCAFAIYMVWNFPKYKFILRPSVLCILIILCIRLNPFDQTYSCLSSEYFNSMEKVISNTDKPFAKGRYNVLGTMDSSESLFAFQDNYNFSSGWNIEGTLHNSTIYNNYIALPLKKYDYIMKQLAFWNVRYLLLSDMYQDLGDELENQLGFEKSDDNRTDSTLYVNNQPSSYYLTDVRSALVISTSMQGFSVQYPNFVQGKSKDLWDYTESELLEYQLIYIIEPDVNTRSKSQAFEELVTKLVNNGISVIIEPAVTDEFDLFGVHIQDITITEAPKFTKTYECPYVLEDTLLSNNSYYTTIRSLYGLDTVYANFEFEGNDYNNAILGTKKIGKGEVVFIGAHMSQYLDAVFTRINGSSLVDDLVTKNSNAIELIYKSIFSFYQVDENYLPEVYNTVIENSWSYDGGSFTYKNKETKKVTISVTYTPRWTATIDGNDLDIGQRENLITLTLPAGEHTVTLHYGITIYGKIGYIISVIGLFVLVIFILFWKLNIKIIGIICDGLINYLQIYDKPHKADKAISDLSALESSVLKETAISLEDISDRTYQKLLIKDMPIIQEGGADKTNHSEYPSIFHETIHENGVKVDIIEIEEEAAITEELSSSEKPEINKSALSDEIPLKTAELNRMADANITDKFDNIEPEITVAQEDTLKAAVKIGSDLFEELGKLLEQVDKEETEIAIGADLFEELDRMLAKKNIVVTEAALTEELLEDLQKILEPQKTSKYTSEIDDNIDYDVYDEVLQKVVTDNMRGKAIKINDIL